MKLQKELENINDQGNFFTWYKVEMSKRQIKHYSQFIMKCQKERI